jgi:hypothetical protein
MESLLVAMTSRAATSSIDALDVDQQCPAQAKATPWIDFRKTDDLRVVTDF